MAVAAEQEMIAKAQEARAKVILAEAEVPKAMAEAFRQGNLGIMDYYKFQNIQADTGMRESIADDKSKDCLLYTSPSPRDKRQSRMPSSA